MVIHLARSSEPLQRGVAIEALCGREVPNAELVSLDAEHLEPRSLGGICPKCFLIAQATGRIYEAGIVSGEELKQQEGE